MAVPPEGLPIFRFRQNSGWIGSRLRTCRMSVSKSEELGAAVSCSTGGEPYVPTLPVSQQQRVGQCIWPDLALVEVAGCPFVQTEVAAGPKWAGAKTAAMHATAFVVRPPVCRKRGILNHSLSRERELMPETPPEKRWAICFIMIAPEIPISSAPLRGHR